MCFIYNDNKIYLSELLYILKKKKHSCSLKELNYMFTAPLLAEIYVDENGHFVCKMWCIWCRGAFGVGLRYIIHIFKWQ